MVIQIHVKQQLKHPQALKTRVALLYVWLTLSKKDLGYISFNQKRK